MNYSNLIGSMQQDDLESSDLFIYLTDTSDRTSSGCQLPVRI